MLETKIVLVAAVRIKAGTLWKLDLHIDHLTFLKYCVVSDRSVSIIIVA
jgi:hypothetical protein